VPVFCGARLIAAEHSIYRSPFHESLEKQMKQIKAVLTSLVLGLAIGMWFGVNIGREVPFYSNPFDTHTLNKKIKGVAGETLEKGGQAIEKTGQELQNKLNK
jgi:hypothetical protein